MVGRGVQFLCAMTFKCSEYKRNAQRRGLVDRTERKKTLTVLFYFIIEESSAPLKGIIITKLGL